MNIIILMNTTLKYLQVCIYCSSTNIKTNDIIICKDCGCQFGPQISFSQDVQYNATDSDKQCNSIHNPLLEQMNYRTGVGGGNSMLKRLNKWAHIPNDEKILVKEFTRIDGICNSNGLNKNVSETAKLLYKEILGISRAGDTKKRQVGLLSACIYQSCKKHNVKRSYQEIAEICEVNKSRVVKGCKSYFQLMSQSPSSSQDKEHVVDQTYSYIDRFTSYLGIGDDTKQYVIDINNKVQKLNILNESPPSVVAGIILLVSVIYNLHLDKNIICLQTGISDNTVTKVYKKLVTHLEVILI